MKHLAVSLFFASVCGLVLLYAAEDSTEAKLFHNDGWFIEQAYRQSHAECERTIQEMKDLAARHRTAEFATAAKLIAELDRRMTSYNNIVQKLVIYYKQKWNQKHYQNMDQGWKDETYKKHKAKLTSVHTLMRDLQQAYNTWNEGRTSAAKKTNKDLIEAFSQINVVLSEALDAQKRTEEAVFKNLETELSAIKNLK